MKVPVADKSARDASQHAVYDEIGQALDPFLAQIEALIGDAGESGTNRDAEKQSTETERGKEEKETDDGFRARMAHTALLGVFLKRTANLMLLSDETAYGQGLISIGELVLSVKEALDAYALGGAGASFFDNTIWAKKMQPDDRNGAEEGNGERAVQVHEACADAKMLREVYTNVCARLEALYKSGADVSVRLLPDGQKAFVLDVNGETIGRISCGEGCASQGHYADEGLRDQARTRAVWNAKRKIHADMGRVLLMTKHYLAETKKQAKQRADLTGEWRAVIRFLRTGTDEDELPDVKKELLTAADAAGVILTFRKDPPTEEDALRDYVKEASAKIVAAVREGRELAEI